MANPEHVEILKQGVEAWNRWKEENQDIRPDLRRADLEKADLRGADLEKAYLYRADLSEAYLSQADLSEAFLNGAYLYRADLSGAFIGGVALRGAALCGANLRRANLSEADLSGSDLRGANLFEVDFRDANLSEADLSGSDLHGADLSRANFFRAELSEANFNNARCLYTIFAEIDLCQVIGLETVRHSAPSIISIETLYKSKGNIPEAFLRGCGVPDQMIEYVKSLTGSPIEYYSCFISYSHKDEGFAQRVHNDLQAKGVRCWFAPHDMKIGDKIRSTIDESIRFHDKTLLILSEHSVQSDWVEHEVEHALDIEKEKKKNVLFPVRVDEAVMESKTGWAGNVRRQRHIGDFTRWKDHDAYSKAFERLLRDLMAG